MNCEYVAQYYGVPAWPEKRVVGITLERHRSRPYRDTVDSVGYAFSMTIAEEFINVGNSGKNVSQCSHSGCDSNVPNMSRSAL